MSDLSAAGICEGEILAQKYRVDRVLGSGAMGVVVAAHHLGLDTPVAIKFLLPAMLQDQDAVARFAREARAAAKIANEHVVRVLDVGTLQTGAPYMVMEFLEGIDLQRWLQQSGPLPIDMAVDFVLQACEAIAEAHELGIVHRDLKPANLYCVRRATGEVCVKVLDFGISKISSLVGSGPSMAMTRTSTMMGTPLYMSPEQMESSRGVDSRTDIWSLATILFELLAGRVPFLGDALPEVCLKVTTHPAPSVRSFRVEVPPSLDAVILKALEKDRNRRWATVGEFCAALNAAVPTRGKGGDRIRRTVVAPDSAESFVSSGAASARAVESIRGLTRTRVGRQSSAPRWRMLGLIAALGAAIVIGGIGLALLIRGHSSGLPNSPAAAAEAAANGSAAASTEARPIEPPPQVAPLPQAVQVSAQPPPPAPSPSPVREAEPSSADVPPQPRFAPKRKVAAPASTGGRPVAGAAPPGERPVESPKNGSAYDERL